MQWALAASWIARQNSRVNPRILSIALAVVAVIGIHAAAPRPNIIVMLSDDVGYSDIGCYGGEIQTPNLDRLAAGGVRFTQFYNTARCCPTRASLLTGLYPHQAGVGHMTENRGHDGYRGELNRRSVTIAEVLRGAGYATFMTGKWHITGNAHMKLEGPNDSWPHARGFERVYATITGAGNYFDPAFLIRDSQPLTRFTDREYQPESYYYTDALGDNSVRFIREHHERTPDKPFFLYVAFTAGHWPLHAREEDIAKYRGKYDAGYEPIRNARIERMKKMGLIDPKWQIPAPKGDWASVSNKAWEARCMEVYAAQLDRMDQNVGKVVAELQRIGAFDNTLILYMQDNGGCAENIGRNSPAKPLTRGEPESESFIFLSHRTPHLRDGRPYRVGPEAMPGPTDTYISYGEAWANVSDTPFREYKHWTHEGGISTPLVVHWPRGIDRSRRGKLEGQPSHLIDVMATCVDLAGGKYPTNFNGNEIKPLEGTSLTPAFRGKSLARKQPIFWEHEGNRAVRDGDWKLVAKENKPWELYNIRRDRTEQNDLASSEPSRADKMAAQWDAYAGRANVLPLGTWRNSVSGTNRLFTLKEGAHLSKADAPDVAREPFTITAKFDTLGKNGVIVAQGATAHGYALFVENGHLKFAFRRANVLTVVNGGEVGGGTHTAKISVRRGGELQLLLDDKSVGTGRAAGLMIQTPADGVEVGADEGKPVGNYTTPNTFGGSIESVEIRLGE
jgi:arylsulfatase A-like enzyme